MKRLTIGIPLFLVCVGFLYQCKEAPSEIEVKPSNEIPTLASMVEISASASVFLSNYLNSEEFRNFIVTHKFTAVGYHRMETDGGEEFYGIDIKPVEVESSMKDYHLVVYPKKDGFRTILFEQEITAETVKLATYTVKEYVRITQGTFSLISSGENSVFDRSCASSNQGDFGGCFACAWNQLNNDVLGIIACTTSPYACIAAATIHCANS